MFSSTVAHQAGLPTADAATARPGLCRLMRKVAGVSAALGALVLPQVLSAPAAHAAVREVHVAYIDQDAHGYTKYDVRFNGSVQPVAAPNLDPRRTFGVKGTLDAYCPDNTLTTQYVKLQVWASRENHRFEFEARCDDTPKEISFWSTRDYLGDTISFRVGATSGVLNSYQYGPTVAYAID